MSTKESMKGNTLLYHCNTSPHYTHLQGQKGRSPQETLNIGNVNKGVPLGAGPG